jgi:hypothetical protein
MNTGTVGGENIMSQTQGAHPLRISTIRRTDGHVSSVVIGVDRLAPDQDIVGRAGAAVETLVAGDGELEGQAPYLYNAVQGQFAIISHGRTDGDSRRMRVRWNPTHDVEMVLGAEAA